jgi:hypothetical protein
MGLSMGCVLALGGCVTTQEQPDGSTRVHISLGSTVGLPEKSSPLEASPQTAASPVIQPHALAPSIRTTPLAGIFTKHPYDGTARSDYPRVAVTVTNWTRNDCWSAKAKIWWTHARSENVSEFSICWNQSVGFAVNNAANLHLFMEQTSLYHTGNVRTDGPKPPMLAIPDRQPFGEAQQLVFQGFIEALIRDTGWQAGAPTNLWLVRYTGS